MVQSKEYPDLLWVPPASWTRGRPSGQPSLIVIHTTEGSEGTTSAENGAAYDARRSDGTSTHYFHDQDTTVQCVTTDNIAHTAGYTGNRRGIQHELCGRAGQSPDQWQDAASEGTLRQAAKQAARDSNKGGIPIRKLNADQVRDGQRGFCGHVDVTYAWGEVDHTDPGKNFPWDKFLGMVREYANPASGDDESEDDMGAVDLLVDGNMPQGMSKTHSGGKERAKIFRMIQETQERIQELNNKLDKLADAVSKLGTPGESK